MFVGRERELRELTALWEKTTPSLVTCRGRRRIGKSALIEEFARRTADTFIAIEGLAPRKGLSDARQRRHFADMLTLTGGRKVRSSSWTELFAALDALIPDQGRTVILLDEISWMGAYNPDFAGYLKIAWDRLWCRHERLVVVLCGSVSAWIAENILHSTGFVGRDSLDLEVGELCLSDCVKLLTARGTRLSEREKLDFLAITGGVPKYLLELQTERSVEENVRRMCFLPNGLLFREFYEMFSSVFGRRAESRGVVLRRLAQGPLSVSELAAAEGVTASGRLTQALEDLRYAGFIAKDSGNNPETGKPYREVRYRLKDCYTRFFLKYIAPRQMSIEQGLYSFAGLDQLPDWPGILGLQFETLVLNHITEILPRLGLERSLIDSAAPYIRRGEKGEGVQIDLLIQTNRTLFVVEIKRREHIDSGIADELARKLERLHFPSRLSVRTALVYEGVLAPSVEANHVFDFLVPFGDLLA